MSNKIMTLLKCSRGKSSLFPYFIAWGVMLGFYSEFVSAECVDTVKASDSENRFIINSDNTILDTFTHLIWMRCPIGYEWNEVQSLCSEKMDEPQVYTWQAALIASEIYSNSVSTDWRLPNTKEAESIVLRNCFNPALEVSVFSQLSVGNFWTSTPAFFGEAWAIDYDLGSLSVTRKSNEYHVRLLKVVD